MSNIDLPPPKKTKQAQHSQLEYEQHRPGCTKLRNEIETQRTKRNETKRNITKRNEYSKRRNETQRSETKFTIMRNEMK